MSVPLSVCDEKTRRVNNVMVSDFSPGRLLSRITDVREYYVWRVAAAVNNPETFSL